MLESIIQRIGQQQRSLLEKERATVQQERNREVSFPLLLLGEITSNLIRTL